MPRGEEQGGEEQTTLWEQSDLLDLVMAGASQQAVVSAPPEAAAGESSAEPAGTTSAAGNIASAAFTAAEVGSAAATATAPDRGTPNTGSEPDAPQDEDEASPQPLKAIATWDGSPATAGEPGTAPEPMAATDVPPGVPEAPVPVRSLEPPTSDAGHSPGPAAVPTRHREGPSDDAARCGSPIPGDLAQTGLSQGSRLSRTEGNSGAPHAAGPAADAELTGRSGASLAPLPSVGTSPPPCPERLLILDTETTALSPEQGQCIEVGAVLFDVTHRAVLMQVSFLLPCERNPAEPVNGIPAAVSRLSQPWHSGLRCFQAMVEGADALLAHNAAFDRQWFGSGELPALSKPWICSMEDIRWPAERQLRPTPSVRDLALAYGVPVWAAHRALTDCIYLVQVFQRCDDLEALLQVALEPRRLVRARLSYDERQLAKDAGFRWNEPVPRAWSRRLSEREIALLPFPVDPVEADQGAAGGRGEGAQRWRRSA